MTSARYDLPDSIDCPAIHKAAALRVLGFKVSVTVESDTSSRGGTVTRWYCTTGPADARALVLGQPSKSPAGQRRDSLYAVCLRTLDVRELMSDWMRTGCDWYEFTGVPAPVSATDPAAVHKVIPPHLHDLAAVAIVLGHTPRPRPVATESGWTCSLLDRSSSGITIADLGIAEWQVQQRHARLDGLTDPITVPGAEPEEHPYLYAREAIGHLKVCIEDEARARRNPTGLFRGKGGRSAAVSASILRESRPAELLELHLAGML